jgi:hypothetical protein
MLNGGSPIRRVVLTMKGEDGTELALVTFIDEDYGIVRNGEPLDGCRWHHSQLDACIHRLLSLAKGQETQ